MHLTQHFLPINNCCLFFSWSFLENTQKPWMRTIIRTIWPATTATKNWWPVATSSKTRTLTASHATRNCTPTTVKSARNRSGPITRWVTYWDWLKSKVVTVRKSLLVVLIWIFKMILRQILFFGSGRVDGVSLIKHVKTNFNSQWALLWFAENWCI